MIKTFRGLIADGAQDSIALHTNDGSMGYRIVKFQIISNDPNSVAAESVMKIYKVSQSTVTDTFDFSDNTLLAGAYFSNSDNPAYTADMQVIFDNEIFNQDIYVTNTGVSSAQTMNFYIELEQMKLDLNEQTVATLKDIRNVGAE